MASFFNSENLCVRFRSGVTLQQYSRVASQVSGKGGGGLKDEKPSLHGAVVYIGASGRNKKLPQLSQQS